jgi:hypothetical protein
VSPSKDIARLGERVAALVEQGLDVAEAYSASVGTNPKAARERARAMEKHAKAVRKHQERLAESRRESVTLTAVSGATAVLGVIDLASGAANALPGSPALWLIVSALAGVGAVRKRYFLNNSAAPEPPALASSYVASDIRREAIGWSEAQGLAAVRRQLVAMVPAVAALHPEAGKELKDADDEAAPALAAQVTRLAVLDQVRRDLPDSQAAVAAADSAEQVRARLAEGVAVYDRLLAAASTMLASPDLGRSSLDVLGPASDALTAYAAGLRTASGE